MRTASSELVLSSLYDLIEGLDNGARLPTVRELMKSFRVSQAAVQEAFGRLREEGLVTSHVGRGTYVVKADGGPGAARTLAPRRQGPDSLLILSNASMNERGVLVQNHIVSAMAHGGGKVVQMSYHNTDHLLEILGSVPSFDAAILQSHFESIPVRLLHLLQHKARALVVDGHSLCGVDVDRVGTDWEEALELALRHLGGLDHRRIGLVSLDTMAQPILSVRRAVSRLADRPGADLTLRPPILLEGVLHPSQSVNKPLEKALPALRSKDGSLPFTALVFLGTADTMGIRQCLEHLGFTVPDDLSVYILGHHDVPTEHFGFFTMAGSSHIEAAEQLIGSIRNRLAKPDLPPQITFLSCREVVRKSTGRVALGGRGRRRHFS